VFGHPELTTGTQDRVGDLRRFYVPAMGEQGGYGYEQTRFGPQHKALVRRLGMGPWVL
jgi:hypothetical protein